MDYLHITYMYIYIYIHTGKLFLWMPKMVDHNTCNFSGDISVSIET